MDLGLNNLQSLICHKTQNKQRNHSADEIKPTTGLHIKFLSSYTRCLTRLTNPVYFTFQMKQKKEQVDPYLFLKKHSRQREIELASSSILVGSSSPLTVRLSLPPKEKSDILFYLFIVCPFLTYLNLVIIRG